MKKILIVGPAWVGDMVMAQSLFKVLKAQDPATIIDVLASDGMLPLLARMPEVHQAHSMPIGHGKLALRQRYRIAQSLKPYAYTQAIVLANSWKSALIPWWANIPLRTGFLGECRLGLLNDWRRLNRQALPRMIDRFAALAFQAGQPLPPIPYPQLVVDQIQVAKTVQTFCPGWQPGQKIIALCPGAAFGSAKRWTTEHYAKLGFMKQSEGFSLWIFGSKKDVPVAAEIQQHLQTPAVDFSGKTRLEEAIDLLSVATIVVSNDSGLMHVAAALNKPLVALYGPTDPAFAPPLGSKTRALSLALSCSPCRARECPLGHHRCMRDLLPEQVCTAINSLEPLCAS
jgi:heptosyltransferase II